MNEEANAVAVRVLTPKLLLGKREAAEALGMSIDSFEKYAQADLPVVRRGKLRLFPVRALEQWIEENATLTIGGR